MKNFAKLKPFTSPSKFKYPSPAHKKGPPPSPPPPPPPLKFDITIAQVYGPAANIYNDIFEVSPTASQHELKEVYLRKRNEAQVKLAKLSNNHNRKSILKSKERTNAKKKKLLLMQINAISEAYQIVVDEQKKKEYDASIGLKEQTSEISFDCNAGEFPGDEQQNKAIEVSPVHKNIDLNSRMKEYLKEKQTDATVERLIGTYDYDIIPPTKENANKQDIISTKENHRKQVQFTLESLGSPSPPTTPEDVKKVPMVSPTGVTGFDNALSGSQEDTKSNSPDDDTISPILRVRQDKEQLSDVLASYLNNLNNVIAARESDDEDKFNTSDTLTVEEQDDVWSSDGTVKVSHCQNEFNMGICVFAEEIMSKASFIADGLCQ